MGTLSTMVVKLVAETGPFITAMEGAAKKTSDVAKVIGGAAVSGVAALGAAMAASIAKTVEWGDQLDSLGDVLGTNADESAALAVAIRGVGGDVGGITGQMAKFAKGAMEVGDKLTPVQEQLKELGVNIYEVGKQSFAMVTVLPTDKLEELRDKLDGATAKLHDMEASYAKAKSPTETMTYNLGKQRELVAALSEEYSAGSQVIESTIGENGPLKGSAQILEEVATKLAKMPDGLEKTTIMTELFGKSGKDLSDTMNALANGGLQQAADKAQAFGLAIGEDGVNKSIAFKKGLADLQLMGDGLAVTFGSELLPIVIPLLQKFTEFARQHMPEIKQAIQGVVNFVETSLIPLFEKMAPVLANPFFAAQKIIIQTVLTIEAYFTDTINSLIAGINNLTNDLARTFGVYNDWFIEPLQRRQVSMGTGGGFAYGLGGTGEVTPAAPGNTTNMGGITINLAPGQTAQQGEEAAQAFIRTARAAGIVIP